MMINIKKKEVSILLAILASLLLTQSAYAADLFTVPETDKSKLWFLDILFPENLAESPLASTMTIDPQQRCFTGWWHFSCLHTDCRNHVNGT